MVVYDFVTPENLAVKYPEDGLFIDGSILFKTDPDSYFENLTELDKKAMHVRNTDEAIQKMVNACMDFSNADKIRLLKFTAEGDRFLRQLKLPYVDTKKIAKRLIEEPDLRAEYNITAKRKIWKQKHGGGLWDADHIVRVEHGGGLCGLENIRTFCISCHKSVT